MDERVRFMAQALELAREAAAAGEVPVGCVIVRRGEVVGCGRNRREEKQAVKRTLGETLKAHRTRCQMTQEFEAEALGVSRQTVSKWENGSADPSTTNLLALAKLYGVEAEDLLRGVENKAE